MKINFLFLVLLIPGIIIGQTRPVPSIKSNTKKIMYRVDGNLDGWNLVPELKPDQLTVQCINKPVEVAFITDVDSVKFQVKAGETINFNIIYNGRDTCWTQVKGLQAENYFKEDYINANKGKTVIELPEVHELVNIIFAITPTGQKDSGMIFMPQDYHKEVLKHFLQFKEHPLVTSIDSAISKDFWVYLNIRMTSCAYIFNGDKIVNAGTYENMGFGSSNLFPQYISLFEDFSKMSGFRKFFSEHKTYYDMLVAEQEEKVRTDEMWKWLEDEFPGKYEGYKIIFSPLINGAHSTKSFSNNDYSETVMFICGPQVMHSVRNKYSEKVIEGILSRIVFTEIDHNYVNPVTDLYAARVDSVFKDVKKWNNSKGYETPYLTFNEYMTFGVFSIYVLDHFNADDFVKINEITEKMMVRRGFYRFPEFNKMLLELYKSRKPGTKVSGLYPPVLDKLEKGI